MKVLVFLLVLFVSYIHCDDVPVFLWGKPSTTYLPALSELSSNEFQAILSSQIDENTVTLVFVEPKLSTEDLSRCKLKTQTCFKHLQNIEEKSYFANVEEPFESLLATEEPKRTYDLGSDGSFNEKIVPTSGDVLYFNLGSNDFAANDAIINKIYSDLSKQNANILAIYTAKASSVLNRKARQAAANPKTDKKDTAETKPEARQSEDLARTPVIYKSMNSLVYLEYIAYQEGDDGNVIVFTTTAASDVLTDSNKVNVTITATPLNINLVMELSAATWSLTGITIGEYDFLMLPLISVNEGFSYYCNTTLTFIYPNPTDFTKSTKLTIVGLQLQPYFSTATEVMSAFGDAFDCTGFTSPGIWGGIFVVFLFLIIISIGISWMLDINTMDRFDDPKGKTIIVSATD